MSKSVEPNRFIGINEVCNELEDFFFVPLYDKHDFTCGRCGGILRKVKEDGKPDVHKSSN
jgi:hypothetical protein